MKIINIQSAKFTGLFVRQQIPTFCWIWFKGGIDVTLQEDIRVRRTKQNIVNAFVALTKEKSIDAITVQEIADKAMVNRATFYAHYRDKQDLYDQVSSRQSASSPPCGTPSSFWTVRSCSPSWRIPWLGSWKNVLKTGTSSWSLTGRPRVPSRTSWPRFSVPTSVVFWRNSALIERARFLLT